MNDFALPQEYVILRDSLRKFISKEVDPIVEAFEESREFPEQIHKAFQEMGLYGLTIPQRYGGQEISRLGYVIVNEELGKTALSVRARMSVNNGLGSQGILNFGTEEQKKRYLPRIASGDAIAAFACTEPDAGSDIAGIKTRAVKHQGCYVLNGSKQFITHSPSADVFTVIARTGTDKGKAGLSAFIVEKNTPGMAVGRIERKMGFHGAVTAQLFFEDCRIPEENLMGGMENTGFNVATTAIDWARLGVSACCVGGAEKLLELAIKYSKERIQFGKPISSFQIIKAKLADIAIRVYSARCIVHDVARKKDDNQDVRLESSIIKYFATETAFYVADQVLQIFGGVGYTKEFPVERFFRDFRLLRIVDGTSEIHQLIIAKELLDRGKLFD